MSIPDHVSADLADLGLTTRQADDLLTRWRRIDQRLPVEQQWMAITREVLSPAIPFAVHQLIHAAVFAEWPSERGPVPAWIPETTDASNIAWLMQQAGVTALEDLQRWSTEHHEQFVECLLKRLEIRFQHPWNRVLDAGSDPASARWFTGSRLNIVDSCFAGDPVEPVIVSYGPEGARQSMTRGELKSLVARVAGSLRQMGLQPGDRVGIDLPMSVEAVAVFLGAIAAGCPAVTVADSFAAREIGIRLRIGDVRCVLTQDVIRRAGRTLPLYEKVREACNVPLIVLHEAAEPAIRLHPGDRTWSEFLVDAGDLNPVACDPDEMTTLLFSSGTTGEPKAIPWDQTTPLKCAFDAHLHHDIHPGDVLCWPTNLGWMMGPWLVYAALLNRARMVLYSGAPTERGFANCVQDANVTMLGVVPSLVSAWRTSSCLDGIDWSSIRAFSSTGECSNPEDMLYLMSRAGYKPIIEYCGGTEIGGGYISGTVVQPAAPGTFSTPALGNRLLLLDDAQNPSDRGEVFLVPPALGLSRTLVNADHRSVYYNGTPTGPASELLRRHGDEMERLPGGYYRAHGRVDDAMNLGGIKVSSTQIELVTASVDGVRESAAIAAADPGGGPGRLVLYVVPDEFALVELSEESPESVLKNLMQRLQQAIRSELNPLFKLHDVVLTDRLPRTASNKIMRRKLRSDYETSKLTPSTSLDPHEQRKH